MNNEPVAWKVIETDDDGSFTTFTENEPVWSDNAIPLYTHQFCKHGVDDGACKECYLEVTNLENPANPYQSITDTKIEPTVVSYTHPAELTDEEIREVLMTNPAMAFLVAEIGISKENIEWFARAILRKASEK